MHVILTGATGLVGSGVLDGMIKMKEISKITILSRRPVQMAEDAKDPRINVIIHKDFGKYDPELLAQLKGASGCVWALGISQTAVGPEEYVKITKTFTLEAAKAFSTIATEQEPFNFVYVSGHGATTKPTRWSLIFARVKGETEVELAALRKANPFFRASSIRPAHVDGAAHGAIQPYIPPTTVAIKLLGTVLGPAIRVGLKSLSSPTEPLGKFFAEVAMGKYQDQFGAGKDIEKIGEFPILENTAFRRLSGI